MMIFFLVLAFYIQQWPGRLADLFSVVSLFAAAWMLRASK